MTTATLFTDNQLLVTAFSEIFKSLEWDYICLHPDDFGVTAFTAGKIEIAVLASPQSARLNVEIANVSAKFPGLTLILFLDLNIEREFESCPEYISGIIPTNATEAQIKNSLRMCADGYDIFPSRFRSRGDSNDVAGLSFKTAMKLTQREFQILQQITDGDANKQIARIFDISLNTVQVHASAIFRKLHVSNRTQAARAFQESRQGLGIEQSSKSKH